MEVTPEAPPSVAFFAAVAGGFGVRPAGAFFRFFGCDDAGAEAGSMGGFLFGIAPESRLTSGTGRGDAAEVVGVSGVANTGLTTPFEFFQT